MKEYISTQKINLKAILRITSLAHLLHTNSVNEHRTT